MCRPRRRGAGPRCRRPTNVLHRAYRDDWRTVQVLISWTGELQRSGPRVAATRINAEKLAVTGRPPFTEWSVLLASGVRCSWSWGANVLAASVWSMQHPEGAAEITGGKRKRRLLGSSKRLDANVASWRRQTPPKDPTCAEMTAYTDELTIRSIQLSYKSVCQTWHSQSMSIVAQRDE